MASHGISKCCALLALMAISALAVRAEEKLLCDFENDADMTLFEMKTGKPSDQHVTHGQKSLKILPGEYLTSWRMPKDWSAYDSLDIDVFVDGTEPVNGTILIGDQPWKDKGSNYWNRHNGTFNLKPGAGVLSIPVNGLFRGEAGSRNGDIHANIDSTQILRLDLGFNGKVTAIYLDNIRFTKETRPAGILAFDFGPESQTVFPGFSAISWNTVFGENGAKAGFKMKCGAPNRARDDTFPTRLYQDYVWFEENGNEFIAEAPNGKVHVWMVFDDCGYWGGETCHHHKRTVSANGKQVYVDDRGADGPNDYLYRFEKIEPKPGDSMWELYMKDLFKPVRFDAEVTDGKLRIQCAADAGWSTKVAAMIVYPDAGKTESEKWVTEIEERNKKEFDTRAAFMGPKPKALEIPADAKAKGFWFGVPTLEDTVTFVDAPGKSDGKLKRTGTLGQRMSFTFAVRPLKDFNSDVKLSATDLSGPAGKIPASNLDLRYIHHLTQRGFNDIAYTIMPMSIRRVDGSGLKLTKELTRQFWITLDIPADAKAGSYQGEVTLSAGELNIKVPLTVDVIGVALDDPDFNIGFLGAWSPRENGYYDLAKLMKQYGMNSFCGGPSIPFQGFDETGKPKLDFKACDDYFKQIRKAGITHPVYSYGGPGWVEGLSDGYEIGETGKNLMKQTGKSYGDILKIVWGEVKAHAEKENWLPIYYGQLDEPRAEEPAKLNLEYHKAYHDAVPWLKVGGFYSVDWKNTGPLEKTIQEIFRTMNWSGVNTHTQDDLDNAKKFGKELHIYNQGLDRYTFGVYCFAEMRKGLKGLMQWHTLAVSGYQWFDLDGREPDPGVINWGKSEVIPTLYAVRCCEGAFDLRLATTVWNLAEKKKGTPEATAAQEYLEGLNKQIGLNQHTPPKGFNEEEFHNTLMEHLTKLMK